MLLSHLRIDLLTKEPPYYPSMYKNVRLICKVFGAEYAILTWQWGVSAILFLSVTLKVEIHLQRHENLYQEALRAALFASSASTAHC